MLWSPGNCRWLQDEKESIPFVSLSHWDGLRPSLLTSVHHYECSKETWTVASVCIMEKMEENKNVNLHFHQIDKLYYYTLLTKPQSLALLKEN